MGDPLADRYRKSFLSPHPWRSGKPPFRIPDSILKDASREVQHFGAPLAGQSEGAAAVKGVTPGNAFGALMRMLGQLGPGSPPPPSTAPAAAATSQMESLKSALRAASSPLLEGALSELELLWKLYQLMVHEEWVELAAVKRGTGWWAAVAEFQGKRGGETLYAELRPVYFRAGIREPHLFIKQIQSNGPTIAGVPVRQGVHPEFAKLLKKADGFINRSTVAQFGSAPVKYIGCFRPSTLEDRRTGVKHLSNHMLGAAVDIDATREGVDRNPHLKGEQIKVVDEVLAFVAAHAPVPLPGPPLKVSGSWLTALPAPATELDRAEELYQQMLAISRQTSDFLKTWLEPWLKFLEAPSSAPAPAQQLRDEAFALVEKLAKAFGGFQKPPRLRTSKGVKQLLNIQANGFISIPADIFVAMLKAGLQSGLEYNTAKDTMHFEIKSPSAFIARVAGS